MIKMPPPGRQSGGDQVCRPGWTTPTASPPPLATSLTAITVGYQFIFTMSNQAETEKISYKVIKDIVNGNIIVSVFFCLFKNLIKLYMYTLKVFLMYLLY